MRRASQLASYRDPVIGLLAVCVLAGCGLAPRQHDYYKTGKQNPSQKEPDPAPDPVTAFPVINPRQEAARPPELAGVLPEPERRSAEGSGSWRALLIGISDYSLSNGYVPNLDTPARDVRQLESMLRDHYDFVEIETVVDRQATRRGILAAMSRLNRSAGRGDNVLVYYAGHGVLRDDGAGMWMAADSAYEEDGIPNSDLKQRIALLPARRVLLVSDSCFSGAFLKKRGIAVKTELVKEAEAAQQMSISLVRNINASREVISSGNLSPVADQGIGYCRGLSPFACQLLTALEKVPVGAALGTTDLFVDIYANMQRNTSAGPMQRPQRGTIEGHAGGEFYFVRRR